MILRITKYFVLSFFFLAFAFLLHQQTGSLVLPHLTHQESTIVVIITFSFLITIFLNKTKKKQVLLKNEKDATFKALLGTEREFKALFDDDLTGIFVTNESGNFIDVNQSFLNIFGYSDKNEVIGKEKSLLYSDASEYDFILNELKNKGRLNNYQTKRLKKNGDFIHVSENIIAKFDVDRNIIQIKSYVFDITDQVTAETLLKDYERKYSKVVNSIASAIYFYRLTGDELVFTGSNSAADKIINISHRNLIGQNIEECFPNLPSHIPDLYKNVAKGDLCNQSFEIEYREDRFSGVYIVNVFRIDQNEIAVNFIDITQRKNEEKKQIFLKNILETLNKKIDWEYSLKNILKELKSFSNCDAVGIRLEKENDFPYYFQEGFSQEFLNAENSICSRSSGGSINFNSIGKPILECACGMLLNCEPDLTNDYITPKGSIWTNYSKDFLDITPDEEKRINPRNTCVQHGYMSIILVPLKIGEKKVGVLQLNNKESNKFTVSDITFYEEIGSIIGIAYEKILNEQSLRDNEELFSSFMDHLPANVYIKDNAGRFIYGNKALTDSFGSTPWKGKNASEIFSKEEADKIAHDDLYAFDNGYLRVEEKFRSPNGRVHDFETQKFVIKRSNKSTRLGGITIDVTERNLLQRRNIENEERWKFALECNQDGVWDWNIENNEVCFSAQWKAMLGFEETEIPNSLDEWSKLVHPDDLQLCNNDLQLHLKGEVPYYSNIHRMLCKDGSYKWILDRGKVIKGAEGTKPVRMIGTHTDLTQKMQMENQLRELNSTKDKLFSIIGHDLRNPIGNIVNFTEFLKEDYLGNKAKSREYLEIINSSAEQTLSLLEDLLLWARTQSGQVEFNPTTLNVEAIFSEVFEILEPNAILKEILLKNSCLKDLNCYADKQMLKTILRNLLQNAIKFTNSDGVIDLSAVGDNDNVLFMVSDNGVGINIEIQKKLFKVGENVSNYGTSGEMGSGLGLILCSEFVKKHGGAIWVESEVGKGSRFYFTLPLTEGSYAHQKSSSV